jgi:penicillin-binding protein 2
LFTEPPENIGFKPENVAVIRDALGAVVQAGTSARAFAGAAYASGGKTGTAQAVSIGEGQKYDRARMGERQRDHALYIAMAPLDDPKIVLALIVENAGWGAEAAAPIARRVFDYWLQDLYPNEDDIAAVSRGEAAAPIGRPRKVSELPWPPGSGVVVPGQTQ